MVSAHEENSLLLVISFDGFRWDYLDLVKRNGIFLTPNFDYFIRNGATIDNGGVKNSFVTITFPNHYSIVTGMYQENHGIVGNVIYDPLINDTLCTYCDEFEKLADPVWFNNGTTSGGPVPIWITNQIGHQNPINPRRSGVYMWPGNTMKVNDPKKKPKYSVPYDESVKFNDRVDSVVRWFANKEVNLAFLYFDEPDEIGHKHGPESLALFKKVKELDDVLGYLKQKLEKINILDEINIIITSDHGMTKKVKYGAYIHLNEVISLDLCRFYGSPIVKHVYPVPGKEQEVYDTLKKVEHIKVYWKKDIPDDYHYRNNRRIGPIVLVADQGWEMMLNKSEQKFELLGVHGYNNSIPDMHPIFIAMGPAFKKGVKVKQFNNVDIYPLMCHVLEIEPSKHDGSLDNIKDVLKISGLKDELTSVPMMVAILTMLLMMLIAFVYILGVCCNKIRVRPSRLYLDEENNVHFQTVNGKVRLLQDYGDDVEEEE